MKGRLRSPLLISVLAHVVVGFGLIQLFAMPNPLRSWLERQRVEFQAERIGFLSLPAKSEVSSPGRRGGDNRVESRTPPVVNSALVVSSAPVTAEPSRVTKETPNEPGGSGPLVGGGGPLRGIQPAFHDPRLWTIPDEIVTAPKTSSERIDSVFAERVAQFRDSMSKVGPRAASRDWTVGKDNKWGVDSTGIKIAGVTIPVGQFRPPVGRMEEARRSLAMRMEIEQQSVRRMNEDEFRRAAQRIRERKDREREESQRKQEPQKQIAAPGGSSDQ